MRPCPLPGQGPISLVLHVEVPPAGRVPEAAIELLGPQAFLPLPRAGERAVPLVGEERIHPALSDAFFGKRELRRERLA